MKPKRKIGVQRGYGPRHAFNAQEGSEAVPDLRKALGPEVPVYDVNLARPSELPTPPGGQELGYGGKAIAWVADQVRQGVLPDEALEAIRKDPTSLDSLMAYANAAMTAGTLLSGGEGGGGPRELPRALPGTGAGPRRGLGGRFEPLREQISPEEFDAENERITKLYADREAAKSSSETEPVEESQTSNSPGKKTKIEGTVDGNRYTVRRIFVDSGKVDRVLMDGRANSSEEAKQQLAGALDFHNATPQTVPEVTVPESPEAVSAAQKFPMKLIEGNDATVRRKYQYRDAIIHSQARGGDPRNKTGKGYVWSVEWPDGTKSFPINSTREAAKSMIDRRANQPPLEEQPPPEGLKRGTSGVRHVPKTKTGRPPKIGVEKGYGPRHAFNAQEGSEAVPGPLPEPPPEDLRMRRDSLGNLRPALVAKMLGKELSGLTKEDVAKLGISLLMGGEGPEAMPNGAIPHEVWQHMDVVGNGVRRDNAGNHYKYLGDHVTEDPETGQRTGHAIVKPVEGPGSPDLHEEQPIPLSVPEQKLLDKQFPSLNKPPYDALKEPGSNAADFKPGGKNYKPGGAVGDMTAEFLGVEPPEEIIPELGSPEWFAQKGKDFQAKNFPQKPKSAEDQADSDYLNWLKDQHSLGKLPEPTEFDRPYEGPANEYPYDLPPDKPRFKRGTTGVRHNPKAAGRPRKIGAAPGFGPRHAANAKEGEDLTEINTDTVPAMLTPREAVLNRNAAELAGRDQIEQLNQEGNKLAEKGVDLAAKGVASVAPFAPRRVASGNFTKFLDPGEIRREVRAGIPKLAAKGTSDMKNKSKQSKPKQPSSGSPYAQGAQLLNAVLGGGGAPSARPPMPPRRPPQAAPPTGAGGFFPPGQGFADGASSVPLPIGSQNPEREYGPPMTFTAPQLHEAAKQAGLSQGQLAGLMKAFQGFGSGYNELSGGAGSSADMATAATGAYQGGISDIGYPPFLMPGAEYHADKGSTWVGPYDPKYLVQRYAGGSRDVSDAGSGYFERMLNSGVPAFRDPGNLGFGTGPRDFGRPSTQASGSDYGGRSFSQNFGFGGFGYAPPAGTPGFSQGPTRELSYFDPQGYPYAQPAQGPDYAAPGTQGLPLKRIT